MRKNIYVLSKTKKNKNNDRIISHVLTIINNLSQKLWEIEDIIEKKEKEVLVKWKDWEGPSTWIRLDENQELQQFIERNAGNPLSCQLHNRNLDSNKVNCRDLPEDIMALRQAIFDSLGDARRTPDGALGVQARTTVKVPFSCASFNNYFRSLRNVDLPPDNGNVDFYLKGDNIFLNAELLFLWIHFYVDEVLGVGEDALNNGLFAHVCCLLLNRIVNMVK